MDGGLNEWERPLCFIWWVQLIYLTLLRPHFPKCTFNDPIVLVYKRSVRVAASTRKKGKQGFCGCSSKALQFHTVTLDHSYILLPLVCVFSCCLLLSPFSLPWQHVIYAIWDTLNDIIFFLLLSTNTLNDFYFFFTV